MIDPASVVYGTLSTGIVLAAENPRHEGYAKVLVAVAVTVLVYWLCHAYAYALGKRLEQQRPLRAAAVGHALVTKAGVLVGALAPIGIVAVAGLAGARLGTAVDVALWGIVAILGALEFVAARQAGAAVGEATVEATVGTLLGLGIVAVKLVLH